MRVTAYLGITLYFYSPGLHDHGLQDEQVLLLHLHEELYILYIIIYNIIMHIIFYGYNGVNERKRLIYII